MHPGGMLGALLMLGLATASPVAGQTMPVSGVTYADVLASPDDLTVNLRYAEDQTARGNLEQAAATLERLLLLQPDWDEVRLFYAATLYRLADYEGAERELELLNDRSLAADQTALASRLYELSRARSKPTRLVASLSAGLGVDSNPGLVPGSRTIDGVERGTDGSADLLGAFRLEHELATGRGDQLFLEGYASLRALFDVDELDLSAGGVKTGAEFYAGDLAIVPYATASAQTLGGHLYVTTGGGGLELRYPVLPSTTVFLRGETVWQDYDRNRLDRFAPLRSGQYSEAAAGFVATLAPWWSARFTASYLIKDADLSVFDYDGVAVSLTQEFDLGHGHSLRGDLAYRHRDFDGPDPSATIAADRVDDRYFARLEYAMPVSGLFAPFGSVPDFVPDLDLTFGVAYTALEANGTDFDSDGVSGDIMLTKRFAF